MPGGVRTPHLAVSVLVALLCLAAGTVAADVSPETPAPRPGPERAGSAVIDRQQRFPCGGVLVTGLFTPEPGKALFEIKGRLVGATGAPLAGETMSVWPLQGDGTLGLSTEPPDDNPRVKTGSDGKFGFKVPAIADDFRVVVGFPAMPDGQVCGIVPVRKDGEVWKIRLTGPSAVMDLGDIAVK